jgi:hypothetical protein
MNNQDFVFFRRGNYRYWLWKSYVIVSLIKFTSFTDLCAYLLLNFTQNYILVEENFPWTIVMF